MDRLVRALKRRRPSQAYEPLEGGSVDPGEGFEELGKRRFSWLEYYLFLLLGISMLWAWNMFLAAAPYFQSRFSSSDWILTHFQSGILTVATFTNLICVLLLAKRQRKASYAKRIITSLVLNITCFTLLALSTILFGDVSAEMYFVFLMFMVFLAALAAGFCQNGVFAFVSGFGQSQYTQGIMTGQGVAGVLPCIVQIVSVLSVPKGDAEEGGAGRESPDSAFIYFLTATGVTAVTLVAFFYLMQRHPDKDRAKRLVEGQDSVEELEQQERKVIPMLTLFIKLRWLALGVAMCFSVTMLFPVFTQKILTVRPSDGLPRLFQPACFIPLGFLFWNFGDLMGRILPAIPQLSLIHVPRILFIIAVLRLAFVPLYFLCNIDGRGAIISSDAFYLIVVQFLFGLTNGYVGSSCMMGAPEWVEIEEREAAGGFMGLMLVGGLTIGSLLSFLAAKA